MHSASDSYSKLSKRLNLRVGDLTPENSGPGEIAFRGSGADINTDSILGSSPWFSLYKTPRIQSFSSCEKCRPRKVNPQLSDYGDSTRSFHEAFPQLGLASIPVRLLGRNKPGHPLPERSSAKLHNHQRQFCSFTTDTHFQSTIY